MIFERGAEHQQERRLGSVKHLKKTAAEQPVINDRPLQNEAKLRRGVNAAAPDAAAEKVEILGMFAHQQRLGFPVSGLLPQVSLDGRAPVVPDETGGAKADLAAAFLQPPAHIHVVA